MGNNITEFLEYDEIQELRYSAIREINEDCRIICDYVESYLGGTAHFDGADYIGTTQSEDLVYKRYKLLDDTVNKCRSKLKHWGFEDKFYELVCQACYPYIKQLFELYRKAKKEYEIYLQVAKIDVERSNKNAGFLSVPVQPPMESQPTPEPTKEPTPIAETQKDLQIDETALLSCFNAKFKGVGHNIDYTANLINDLHKKRVGKDFARIALLIQDSSYLITTWKREEFSKWHSHFCKVVGCKYVKYNPCKLRGDEYKKMKGDFYYL